MVRQWLRTFFSLLYIRLSTLQSSLWDAILMQKDSCKWVKITIQYGLIFSLFPEHISPGPDFCYREISKASIFASPL